MELIMGGLRGLLGGEECTTTVDAELALQGNDNCLKYAQKNRAIGSAWIMVRVRFDWNKLFVFT